jgi:hypothetical protein
LSGARYAAGRCARLDSGLPSLPDRPPAAWPVGTGHAGNLPVTRERDTPSWKQDTLDWECDILDWLDWPTGEPSANTDPPFLQAHRRLAPASSPGHTLAWRAL